DIFLLGFADIFFYFNALGLLSGLLFIIFLNNNLLAKLLFNFVWLPSLGAGILTAITSSNAALNFNIGFFPTAILAFVYAYLILQSEPSYYQGAHSRLHHWYPRVILIYGLLISAYFQTVYIYAAPMFNLAQYKNAKKYTIPGPFYGLYLAPFWTHYYTTIQHDIKKIDTDAKYIYFGPIAGGYLLVDKLKPADYILYCPFRINHYDMPIKMPSYVYANVGGIKEPYIPSKWYKKISTNDYFELYYASGLEHT
ncbi:MAG TPA: hypothetical protein VHD33_01700, partial [Legionellaceae bacterium]|nr:hypothetical protein [Legionellaceae bacterium]